MNIFYYNTVSDNAGGGGNGLMAGIVLLFILTLQLYIRMII